MWQFNPWRITCFAFTFLEELSHVVYRRAEILNQIQVIFSSPDRLELLLAETLLIYNHEPTLNYKREGKHSLQKESQIHPTGEK